MWLISISFALPVFHDAEPADAVRWATERLGDGAYEPVSVSQLRTVEADAAAGSELTACSPGAPLLDGAMSSLRSAVLNATEVEAALETTRNAAACHGAEVEQLSRMAFLAGVAAIQAGDESSARAHFEDALAIQPSLEWDGDFAARFSGPFNAAAGGDGRGASTRGHPRTRDGGGAAASRRAAEWAASAGGRRKSPVDPHEAGARADTRTCSRSG